MERSRRGGECLLLDRLSRMSRAHSRPTPARAVGDGALKALHELSMAGVRPQVDRAEGLRFTPRSSSVGSTSILACPDA